MFPTHPQYKVVSFERVAPYTLRVRFDDATVKTIDFEPVLEGEVLEPLRDELLFSTVRIDPEFHTLIWDNDADFNPNTLHDWDTLLPALLERAREWKSVQSHA